MAAPVRVVVGRMDPCWVAFRHHYQRRDLAAPLRHSHSGSSGVVLADAGDCSIPVVEDVVEEVVFAAFDVRVDRS